MSLDESTPATIQDRKADHLRICLEDDVQCRQITTGLENYRFIHCGLPELSYDQVDISTTFLDKALRTPLLISSMTGGTEQARLINQRLAVTAQKFGLAMGVGSQRVAVERPELANTFNVRHYAPNALLFANLGAVQLNYSYGLEHCQRVVDWLEADALILHLNPLQECVQTRGDTDFSGLMAKIETLCAQLPIPIIAKEVGNGISGDLAQKLINIGISAIDTAGAGGTSWARVESERAEDVKQRRLGQTFSDWGMPTAECIVGIRAIAPKIPLIASGGLRNGLDVAKTLALGADIAGMALPFLKAADHSEAALDTLSDILIAELKTALFCTGQGNLKDLKQAQVLQHIP
ncbi:type 2 isopentenyl-diphosphate Delta-isomerase [Leptothoe spongobia TAU-MAC 1115]|uniref:Isopentenyl-diphosphate delta-isomerase n=1 Tax=Leptothoe spongobia TAU-MAC 1115 TaxID=1967444 RepID=A0A947GP72_9CYAN|nr:type 2 isopentenyl-diphosphate Delta-isomerase [Leptothoe spongobia TAU-MAC 1115]